MRRLLISLLAIATFLGCSKDDYPNDVIRTLASADCWLENETYVYSEPNGEGDIISHIDPNKPLLLGHNYERFTIKNNILTRYISVNSTGGNYYKEYVMKQEGDDQMHYKLVTSDGEFYFKILEYDSNNLKAEYNFVQVNSADKVNGEYVKKCTYRITHFKKHIPSDSKWKDMYMTEKEYLEYLEKYW